MHLSRLLMRGRPLRGLIRHTNSTGSPVAKVLDTKDEDCVKVTFRYCNSPNLSVRAPRAEKVQVALSRIKLVALLQHKKEEIRNQFLSKFQDAPPADLTADDIDVSLYRDEVAVDDALPNGDVWPSASTLRIGDTMYDVRYNMPAVISLSLPDYIVAGCAIRPHFIFELASVEDSLFSWYRSVPTDAPTDSKDLVAEGDPCWLKVAEGFIYFTTPEDIGCHLRLVCTPRMGDEAGLEYAAESPGTVERPPEFFAFEERQLMTDSFCGDESFRCLSYNVLANCYVEKRKFPYCSDKARDAYYRKQILLKEILGYKSDVLCLQEVQERVFDHDVLPVLSKFGYTGYYTRKGGRRYEGLATLIRTSKFRLLKRLGIRLNAAVKDKDIFMGLLSKVAGNFKDMSKLLAQDSALQVSILEHAVEPHQKLVVANTHLYSNKDNPEVRLIQAAVCTYFIEHVIKTENMQSASVVFCGDFNSLPDSTTFDFISKGTYDCCDTWQNSNNLHDDSTLRHGLKLGSACGTPEYTNYTADFQGCLDYIFYSSDTLRVAEVVPLPAHEHVTAQVALPNEMFPSDHIALVCRLGWKCS